MPHAAAGRRNERRAAPREGRWRLSPLLLAAVVPLALASCVSPPPAPGMPGTRTTERVGSRRPVLVVQAPPAPGSRADSIARADSIRVAEERRAAARADSIRVAEERAAAQRREAERVAAARVAAERAAAERREAERVAAERRAAERREAERVVAERREAERREAERREAERREAERVVAERREAERRAAEQRESERRETELAARRAAEQRAAEERIARAQLDSLRARERARARALDSLRAAEQAVAARTPAPSEPALQQPLSVPREGAPPAAAAAARPPAARPPAAAAAPRDPNVGIVDGPDYRLAGRHTFRFAGAPPRERVQWTVTQYKRSADGREEERRVRSARGTELELELDGVPGGESRYLVAASAGPVADTAIVWAFPGDTLASFTWRGDGHPDVRVWTTVPSTLSRTSRLVVVMHGDGRDAVATAVAWERWARETDRVVVAPEFDARNWPGERGYVLGNLFAGAAGDALAPEPARSYAVVEAVARGVGTGLGLRDPSFDIWGHGAGGEFVHRFLLFRPRAPIRIAVAANPDRFTLPDTTLPFPAGVRHEALDIDRGDLVAWTRRMLVVMRGSADTLRTGLPSTPGSPNEGPTRFARAAAAIEAAKKVEPRVAWWLLDVPGAGHDPRQMAPAAQMLLERMR